MSETRSVTTRTVAPGRAAAGGPHRPGLALLIIATAELMVLLDATLDQTIIRPARLTNGPATGRLRAQPRLPVTIGDSISRAGLAQFVLSELDDGAHLLSAPAIAATAPL